MIERLTSRLKEQGSTLAVAESCTGGRLAAAFTAEPGASDYFLGGVVSYSEAVKADVLSVPPETLEKHGAVSRECAEAMARGVRKLTGADYTISTTGVAGPGGGTVETPVGTVWIAVSSPAAGPNRNPATNTNPAAKTASPKVTSRCLHLEGSRDRIMTEAVGEAIKLLHETVTLPHEAAEPSQEPPHDQI